MQISYTCVALVPGLSRPKVDSEPRYGPTAVRSTIASLSLHRSPYSISCIPKSASGPSTVRARQQYIISPITSLPLPALFTTRSFFHVRILYPVPALCVLFPPPARLHHIAICFLDERGPQAIISPTSSTRCALTATQTRSISAVLVLWHTP